MIPQYLRRERERERTLGVSIPPTHSCAHNIPPTWCARSTRKRGRKHGALFSHCQQNNQPLVRTDRPIWRRSRSVEFLCAYQSQPTTIWAKDHSSVRVRCASKLFRDTVTLRPGPPRTLWPFPWQTKIAQHARIHTHCPTGCVWCWRLSCVAFACKGPDLYAVDKRVVVRSCSWSSILSRWWSVISDASVGAFFTASLFAFLMAASVVYLCARNVLNRCAVVHIIVSLPVLTSTNRWSD